MSNQYTFVSLRITFLFVITLYMTGCIAATPQSVMLTPQVSIQSDVPGKEEVQQPIELDNCNGKADTKRVEERSQSVESTISAEVAVKFGISAEAISAEVQAAVGMAGQWGDERKTSIELVAPPGTRMIFQIVWIGSEQLGIIQNLRASNIPIAFRSFKPTDVRIKSQYDIGCPTPNPNILTLVVTPQPPSQPVAMHNQEVPTTPEDVARKWGGIPEWWYQIENNGWKLSATLTLNIENGWRIDYTDPNGNIKSCGDKFESGVYGPASANVIVATLWYVPGETRCPSWTVWSQNHP